MLDDLNEDQLRAATAPSGPAMIVAGPGTGKTKTLVARLVYLLHQQKRAPSSMGALTFTNKAAREMKVRLEHALPDQPLPLITTFHGFAHTILEEHNPQDLREFVSAGERQQIIRSLKKHAPHGLSVRDVGLHISKHKNDPHAKDDALRPLVDAYNLELATRNLRDFDDLLLELRALLQNPATRNALHVKYRTYLVDEFQDTNALQYELLQMLNATDDIFVIGDPHQSIYGFRGAGGDVFGTFLQDFPHADHVTLTANYRSTPEVVAVVNAIFPDTTPLQPQQNITGIVRNIEVLNEYGEATWVLQEIQRELGGSDMLTGSQHHAANAHERTFRDFAILYRSRADAKAVQKYTEQSGIPYQIAGEGSPYEHPAVQEILAALAYVVHGTAYKKSAALEPHKAELQELKLPDVVAEIIAILHLETDKNHASIRAFCNSLLHVQDLSIADYLEYVQAIAEQEFYDPRADAVTFLTIHASKGLEFSRVFLLAAEEGSLPHMRKNEKVSIEEEQRLFYVAVSRAAQSIDIIHARTRGGESKKPSRFLKNVPLEQAVDPELQTQARRAHKREQKRAQTSLF
jgi:superfamily I DNA/RNA helicase